MIDLSRLSVKELAAYVSDFFRQCGVEIVLTGGACVSIYTDNKYLSYDLDFVNIDNVPISNITSILKKIGYKKSGRIFINKKVKYSIDILNPPLSVGDHKIKNINNMSVRGMLLKLLSPTDSVMDRLAAFYFWNDHQALHQALMVAKDQEIDFNDVKRWSEQQGESDKYQYFLRKYTNK